MLAERAPSVWLASQTTHCAAATVASSPLNAAVQARSRIASPRKPGSSSMTSRSPSMWALPAMAVSRSAGEVATSGIWLVSCSGGSPRMVPPRRAAARRRTGSAPGLDHHEEDDDHDERAEEHPAALDLLDRREDLRRRRAGRSTGRWRRRCQRDEVVDGVSLDRERVGDRDEVQDDAGDEPRLVLWVDLERDQEQHAGDPLEDRKWVHKPIADRLDLSGAEVGVLRLLAGLDTHDRKGERGAEREDRPHDVQEQEERRQLR